MKRSKTPLNYFATIYNNCFHMMHEAESGNHRNYLVAGIQSNRPADLDCIAEDQCAFVQFGGGDIAYRIVGMSDMMPYRSKRFCDLGGDEIAEYENGFRESSKGVLGRNWKFCARHWKLNPFRAP